MSNSERQTGAWRCGDAGLITSALADDRFVSLTNHKNYWAIRFCDNSVTPPAEVEFADKSFDRLLHTFIEHLVRMDENESTKTANPVFA